MQLRVTVRTPQVAIHHEDLASEQRNGSGKAGDEGRLSLSRYARGNEEEFSVVGRIARQLEGQCDRSQGFCIGASWVGQQQLGQPVPIRMSANPGDLAKDRERNAAL